MDPQPNGTPEPGPSGGSAVPETPVVLVTGAGGGIGRAVTARLLADGRTVVATDVDPAALDDLRTSLDPAGAGREPVKEGTAGHLHVMPLDVRDTDAVERVISDVEAGIGPIDGLVNGAGILVGASAHTQRDEDWALLHDVNATGVMRVSRAVTRNMARRQRGAVVTIGSNAAAVARDALSAYAASKAAAKHYTLCLGIELAPLGIRCNVVSPGSTDTPMLGGAWADQPGNGASAATHLGGAPHRRAVAGTPEAFWPGIPLGRVAQPDWIADAVAFLLSPQSRHIALHDLRVDGGATLGS